MDPITIFSLVSSIITVVDFSKEAIDICEQLVKDGSTSKHTALEQTADSLDAAIADLDEPLDGSPADSSREDKVVTELCCKCRDTASVIRRQLVKLKRDGGLLDAIKKTVQSMRKSDFIEQKRKELEGYERVLNTRILVRLDRRAIQQTQMFEGLLERMNRLTIDAEDEQGRQRNQERARKFDLAMQSLRFPEMFTRQEQIPDAYRNTYEWIFEDSARPETPVRYNWANFAEWLKTGYGTYWIHGKPGSGKSTLMSFIEQDDRTATALQQWAGSNANLLMPSFFFWESGTEKQKSVEGLLQSLLYQILSHAPDLLDAIDVAPFLGPIKKAWTERRLVKTLKNIMVASKDTSTFFCFFIDGLDEFIGDRDILRNVVKDLSNYQNSKTCVSSRPEQSFHRFFRSAPQLRLQDLTHNDIEFYVNDRLGDELLELREQCRQCKSSLPQPHSNQCALSLMTEIVSKASGVFLWVKIVTEQMLSGLRDGDSIVELRQRLDELPQDLERLYAHMLAKLPDSYRREASSYFELLIAMNDFQMYHHEKITVSHIAFLDPEAWHEICAQNLQYFESDSFRHRCDRLPSRILSRCAGLVQIDDSHALTQYSYWLSKGKRQDYRLSFDIASPTGAKFRNITFIHKSVLEFLTSQDNSLLQISKTSGLLSLTRAHLGLGCLFHKLVIQDALSQYGCIGGYADFLMRCLSFLDTRAGEEPLKSSTIEEIDEVTHLAYPMLRIIHSRLNPPEANDWNKRCHPYVFAGPFFFYFSQAEDGNYTTGRPGLIPRLCDELSLYSYYGLLRSVQKIVNTRADSIDWNHLLQCIVYGQFRREHFSIFPSYQQLRDVISQALAHGADLQENLPVRQLLIMDFDNNIGVEFLRNYTYLTALVSQTLLGDSSPARLQLIDYLLTKDVRFDQPILSFLTPSAWDLDSTRTRSARNGPRIQPLLRDVLVRQISLPSFFQHCTQRYKGSKIGEATAAVRFRDLLLAKGVPSSDRFSYYGCYDATSLDEDCSDTTSLDKDVPRLVFYSLDEEQSSLISSLKWLPFCDWDFHISQNYCSTTLPFSDRRPWDEETPDNWSPDQIETTIGTIERVRGSLRKDQFIGYSDSPAFVLGDESTYISHSPEEGSQNSPDLTKNKNTGEVLESD